MLGKVVAFSVTLMGQKARESSALFSWNKVLRYCYED